MQLFPKRTNFFTFFFKSKLYLIAIVISSINIYMLWYDIFRDITTICVNAMLQLYFANILDRISLSNSNQAIYLIPFFLSIVGFGVMGNRAAHKGQIGQPTRGE